MTHRRHHWHGVSVWICLFGLAGSIFGAPPAGELSREQQQRLEEEKKKLKGSETAETAKAQHTLGYLLYAKGDFAAAQPHFERALQIRRKVLGESHVETAESFTNLGTVLYSLKKYAEARPHYEQALRIRLKLHGESHAETAASLQNLGLVLDALKDYTAARPYYEQALKINRKVLGETHLETLKSVHAVAFLLNSLRDPQAALPYFEQSVKICRKVFGDENLDTATSLNNLGLQHKSLGNVAASRPYFEQVLQIHQKVQGDEHAKTIETRKNLAFLLYSLGDYAAARPHFEKILKINRKRLGDEHPDTANSFNNLGMIVNSTGDSATAKQYYEQALKIWTKALGSEHEKTAGALNNLGTLHHKTGNFTASRQYLEQALRIRRKVLGEEHADTAASLSNLGVLHESIGDYAAARGYYEQALRIVRKVHGEAHPKMALSLGNLGLLLQSMGDSVTARSYAEQVLKIQRKTLGDEHPDTALAFHNLGGMLYVMGEYEAALLHYEQALKIRRKVLGDSHFDTAGSLEALGALHLRNGNDTKARPYLEQTLTIKKKVLGESHPEVARTLVTLGFSVHFTGDRAGARPYYEQALKINQQALGESHPDTIKALNSVMVVEAATGHWLKAAKLEDQARRSIRRHVARVLPALSDKEQLKFLQQSDSEQLHGALTFAKERQNDREIAALTAAWLLNGKGVAQAALAERALLLRDVTNPQLAESVKELVEVRQQLARLALSTPKSGEESAHRDALRKLSETEERLARGLTQSRGQSAEREAWVELDTLRQSLRPDAVFVDIACFEPFNFQAILSQRRFNSARYMAWVTPASGRGDVQVVDLGPAEVIDAAVVNSRKAIANAGLKEGILRQRGEPMADRQARVALQRVADLVWKPLADKFGKAKRVVISPDAELWLVPWGALPVDNNKMLIEQYVLDYVVSGRDIVSAARPREKRSQNAPVIFANPQFDMTPESLQRMRESILGKQFGTNDDNQQRALSQLGKSALGTVLPLPWSQAEAQAIAPQLKKLAGTAPRVYTGASALESVFKKVRSPKVVTLSTHGFFLPDQAVQQMDNLLAVTDAHSSPRTASGKPLENPLLRCGTLLAGCNNPQSGNDDGILTGIEIVGVDLRGTELVVLSACETGIGTVRNGEGVAGLRQAFQLAGAEAVVATLWQIPDLESAELMNDFFSNLAAGQTRGDALRNAQLKRISARRQRFGAAHPYFWAAFTLTGQ